MKKPKLFIGHKIREARLKNQMTQKAFAEALNVSTSYLNQLENNQRHVTAGILLALAQTFGLDLKTLGGRESDILFNELKEASKDELSHLSEITERELALAVKHAPQFAAAYSQLYKTANQLKHSLIEFDQAKADLGLFPTPYEEVRDYYHSIDNYIDEIDKEGEKLSQITHDPTLPIFDRLQKYLQDTHQIKVIFGGSADYPNSIRYFDTSTKTLHLNPSLPRSSQTFQIAFTIALIEQDQLLDQILSKLEFKHEESYQICRIGLANYFAGSVLLPYESFLERARLERYDIDLLRHHFGASREQVCHRLSTLQRPGNLGIPFFFARIDQAGNITKRHSATKLQFARFGSACPLWNAHQAFSSGSEIIRQLAQTSDGEQYLSFAFEVQSRSGGFKDPVRRHALTLGCEVSYLNQIVYGDGLDAKNEDNFDPIGISCRTCERKKCHQRSIPPSRHQFNVNINQRNLLPYEL